MANSQSALKRVRQTKTRTEQNRVLKSRIKSSRKAADAALADGDAAKVAEAVRTLVSATDRAVKRGAVHANYSSRMKSRYASKVAAASA
ncbi:30S ribosomal protein S20 [Verrucomicrobiales bacterium]|nr:30S ribosomal protein S20 [Verrucomicrobiales bacterium]MDB4808345.1 30S ribosomal protein S20 [Verrucomicrobiales bacterium]